MEKQVDDAKFFPMKVDKVKFLLINMGLNEYQASALSHLLYLGETKVTTLSKASGVPAARVYGVMDELSQRGLVTVRPGRPVRYSPMPPDDITSALISDARDEARRRLEVLQEYSEDFQTSAGEIFLKAGGVKGRTPLMRIVSRDEVSLQETRKLYLGAKERILIMTGAMEYFDEVYGELKEVVERGVKVKVLMMSDEHMDEESRAKRDRSMEKIKDSLGDSAEIRLSDEMNLRGCIIDPDNGGRALFMAPEHGVPDFLKEAAITSHPGVVKGLVDMFELIWKLNSTSLG
ncbi:MAG: hypothetical protein JSV27_03195 [Candidatus Bathyarchaeota archaeon]|nr:MAG: hypothetical protein JSV27_03195 [Candidatus Bathyarchaeota archaeon]